MKTAHIVSHTMENIKQAWMLHGLITAQEESGDQCHLYVGSEALNDMVATYLTNCDRSVQERFMQTLTDHIRKVDNVEA